MKLRQRLLPFLLLTLLPPLTGLADRIADERACCNGCNQATYKVVTRLWNAECNTFNAVGTCTCLCLYTDDPVPNPLPEGRTADMYLKSYPITNYDSQTNAPVSIVEIAAGPFVDDIPLGRTAAEKCAAAISPKCPTETCSWYRLRTSLATCPGSTEYSATPDCFAKCLRPGYPPWLRPPWIPQDFPPYFVWVPGEHPDGVEAEDYSSYYPVTVAGQYRTVIVDGPYSATCNKTAAEVAEDASLADRNCSHEQACDGGVTYGKKYAAVYQGDSSSWCFSGIVEGGSACDAQPADDEGGGYKYVWHTYPQTYEGQWNAEKRWYVVRWARVGVASGINECGDTTPDNGWTYSITGMHPIVAAGYPYWNWCTSGVYCYRDTYCNQLVSGPYCTSAEASAALP
ncbi:MAG: hypothetical protein WC708_13440 [Lentisphaeria bacterium]